MFRAIICGADEGFGDPSGTRYLVSGPLAGPWLFLVLGSLISADDSTVTNSTAAGTFSCRVEPVQVQTRSVSNPCEPARCGVHRPGVPSANIRR
jgi:hypothetical protein